VEEITDEAAANFRAETRQSLKLGSSAPTPLPLIETTYANRLGSGLKQVDDVLGGGMVPGSVILLAGEPGVGKSTLLLQVAKMVSERDSVLYITGEESAEQIKLRAQRLGIAGENILVSAEQSVSAIEKQIQTVNATLVIVDSIQSIFHPEITSAPGSVSQVRECAFALITATKLCNCAMVLVGHVTKEGSIAGPRVLEHMVDVVLQFDGDRARQLRILKTSKNRFGNTSEIGIFAMGEQGLEEVSNPSALFLGDRLNKIGLKQAASGTAVISGDGGSRSLLLEVQALVGASPYPAPRRVANGWDGNRLLQILAVLEKKLHLALCRYDVYVNIVGGFEFSDPAGDLGVACAVASSYFDRSVDPALVAIGEIGLSGEIRSVAQIDKRLKEASRLGFTKAIVPKSAMAKLAPIKQMQVFGVEYLAEALEIVMPGQSLKKEAPKPAFAGKGQFNTNPAAQDVLPEPAF
jgi:DNA repair protein RadA/Sms